MLAVPPATPLHDLPWARIDGDCMQNRIGAQHSSSSRQERSALKRFEFDPAKTWRRRRRDECRVLSAMERRYLLDLVAQIELSGGGLSDELFVAARRVRGTDSRRTARPLGLLVKRGLLATSAKGDKLQGSITPKGHDVIRTWFASKPPDFIKRFPRIYRELRLCDDGAEDVPAAECTHASVPPDRS
jgi:hypothetical protein